jgi:hypothetical protein
MMFLIFGSSASGKTYALEGVKARLPELAVHDFDEIGVPPGADAAWRQDANEHWLARIIEYQAEGRDVLLAGQTPFGELLGAPSATSLESLSGCLVDCDDETRTARLRARGEEWFKRSAGELQAYLNWADWMRRHAQDPQWRQDVIRQVHPKQEMRWSRWDQWQAGDPRWRIRTLDTSTTVVDDVADELASWVESERRLVRSGHHPLGRAALRHLDLSASR